MYSRGGYSSNRFSSPTKAPTPPPPDNSRLSVSMEMNTISSFQQIRDWLYTLKEEKDLKLKDSDIENRALAAWQHWQSAWRKKSVDAVEYEWDPDRKTIVNL